MTDPFAHLHVHTAHSLLDGLGRLDDVCDSARNDPAWAAAGIEPAIAVTDHGTLSGTWRFAKAAKARGVKPIMGCEFYVSFGSRFEQNSIEVAADDLDLDSGASASTEGRKKQKRYEHISVLAINETGWRNLVLLNNIAQDPETAWHKPRIDLELLCEHNAGLVVMTGCLGGPIAGSLLRGENKRAHEIMEQLHDAFSDGQKDPRKKRLFVEVMEHGIDVERALMPKLLRLAKEFAVEVVATNDAHFVEPEHHLHHDAWLCTNTRKKLSDPDRWKFNGEGYHLRSAAEMRSLFDDQNGTAKAVSNSLLIAEMADKDVIPGSGLRIPAFDPPADWKPSARATSRGHVGSTAYLYDKVWAGALLRYDPKGLLGGDLPSVVTQRLGFEFKTITGMGLGDYFLIVDDLITWARANGIRVGPGRGSAAGCAISFCLGIVQVEPIANGLLFERFLNTERAGMPDIDIDFDAAGRDRVFAYLAERWGTDRVARLGSFGVALSKGAMRAAARVLDMFEVGEALSKAVPTDAGGKPMSFAKMTNETNPAGEDFRRRVAASDEAREVADLAAGFEDVIDKVGIHACGVIVSDESLESLVPYRVTKDGQRVTQWDGKDIDEANFLKIDALSLRNLDIISSAVAMILATTGEDLDEPRVIGETETGEPILGLAKIDSPPTDPNDPEITDVERARCKAAWEIIAEGRTAGLFQLESPGMTQLCIDIRAENLEDLSAIVALYRPGPLGEKMHDRYALRKHGHEAVDYGIFTAGSPNTEDENEYIAEVLDETFGVPVYQEQLMQLGEVVAGFGPAEKNRIRKAVSKKVKSEMEEVGRLFVEGAMTELLDEDGDVVKMAFAEQTAIRLWDAMKSAGDYSFNKAHSFAYGRLGYITAYLKANWPTEYGAALLSVTSKSDKRLGVLTSLRDEGIVVSPPDVNESMAHTAVIEGRVVIGLSEILDVGTSDAEAIVAARQDGPFVSLADLVSRTLSPTGSRLVNTAAVEALIEAGAMDSLAPERHSGSRRLGMFMIARAVLDHPDTVPPEVEWGVLKKARLERRRLGVLLSAHPLSDPTIENAAYAVNDLLDEAAEAEGATDRFGGQLRFQNARSFKAIELSDVVADTKTEPVITMAVVAQWAVSAGHWGRRASFTLDSADAWISGVAWSETLRVAEDTGNLPEVGDIVVVAGLRKLRKSPGDNGNGDIDSDAAIERPEMTAYVINVVKLAGTNDTELAGIKVDREAAPAYLGIESDTPAIVETTLDLGLSGLFAPEVVVDGESDGEDSPAVAVDVDVDDGDGIEDVEEDPFGGPLVAQPVPVADDEPAAEDFFEDAPLEEVTIEGGLGGETPTGAEPEKVLTVVAGGQDRQPPDETEPPDPADDGVGSAPGRDEPHFGSTIGTWIAASDKVAESWDGRTDIVVIEVSPDPNGAMSNALRKAIAAIRREVDPFIEAVGEWTTSGRAVDVTYKSFLPQIKQLFEGEGVRFATQKDGVVIVTWFVLAEAVEGAAAYRKLTAITSGEPGAASGEIEAA